MLYISNLCSNRENPEKKAAQQSFFYILSRLKMVHTIKWVLHLFCTPCKSKSPPVLWLNGWWVEKERRVGSRGPRRFFFSFFSLTARLLCLDPWGNGMETVAVATHYMYNNILSTKIISPTFIWHKQIYWKPRKKGHYSINFNLPNDHQWIASWRINTTLLNALGKEMHTSALQRTSLR